jgi:hypothetical protein
VFNRGGIPGTISLGSAIPTEGFFKKLHQRIVRGAFLRLFCRMTLGVKQENRTWVKKRFDPLYMAVLTNKISKG